MSLLIPPESSTTLTEILPLGTKTSVTEVEPEKLPITFEPQKSPKDFLQDPADGKTVLLVASRKLIETIFVTNAEKLEEQDVKRWNIRRKFLVETMEN